MMRAPILLRVFVAILTTQLAAQDLTPKAKPQTHPIFLHNGVIHTVSGPTHRGGGILFASGKIVTIRKKGEQINLPDHTQSIDLEGKHVYPGLVTVHTSLGLAEIGAVPMSIDTTEVGDITPEVRANIAVNPDSTAIPVARSNGILTAGVFPSGGMISGRISAMTTDGWTWEDMTIRGDVGLALRWPRSEDDQKKLDAFVEKARAWHRARKADSKIETDVRLEAMDKVLRRAAKVFVLANELAAIEGAVQWGAQRNLDIVIVGGRDAILCTKLLKRHGVEVVLSGTHSNPKRRDSDYDERFVLPKLLQKAGIRWCLGSGGRFANERNLPYQAATAVAFGLSEADAIRSITLAAAEVLGVADRVGSLQASRDATLLVTDGSPLDLTTKLHRAFIQGRDVPLLDKQKGLAEKYRAKYAERK